nr:TonB-dependent receptor [Porphyromonas pogonae]
MSKKKTFHVLLFCSMLTLLLSTHAYGQKVTVDYRQQSIKVVLKGITDQLGYTLAYSKEAANLNDQVSIKASNEELKSVLGRLLSSRHLDYEIKDKKLYILYKNEMTTHTNTTTTQKQQTGKSISVKGSVVDDKGGPVIGASITIINKSGGVTSDVAGKFVYNFTKGDRIRISSVGYASQVLVYNGEATLKIVLKEDSELLNEVVVIGYGTIKKSDMTGAVSSVDTKELGKIATTNPAEALQGKVSGVSVRKMGGNAGAGVNVKIRGISTFGSNEPLYIIDGFPGDINNVNPQDIESMEILKDGAAAAIYGSVAANGVVIITTKNGKKGKTKVDFNSYVSFVNVAKKLEMLDAQGYKQVHKQMYENYNMYATDDEKIKLPAYITNPSDVNTDWQDAILRTGLSQSYLLSIRGGADNATYSLSYNRAADKGIFLGNNYRHDNVHAKLNLTKGIFKIESHFGFKFTDTKQPGYSLKEMYMISPLVPILDPKQPSGYGLTNFDDLPNNRNIMADYNFQKYSNKSYHTTANGALTVNITDWLNFKTAYGYRGEHQRRAYHTPVYVADYKSKSDFPTNSETTGYWDEQVFDNILSFNKTFDKHSVNAMAGTSITDRKYSWNSVSVEGKTIVYKVENGRLVTTEEPKGFLDQSFETIDAGKGGTFDGSGSKWIYRRASFFGRLNYSYDSRYLLQFTIRRDGSSKFGKDSRWGTFPSLALGWKISEEDFFIKDGFINSLKLRASWGRLGNENALGYYDFQALINTANNKAQGYVKGNGENPWPGSIARDLENRSLQWETSDNKNIGLDFGLFNNKLTGSFNYFYNQTEDLLITKVLPPSAGYYDPVLNVGKIRDTGIEFELKYNGNIGDFKYGAGMNFSFINNKVVSLAEKYQVLYGEGLKYGSEHFPTQTREGKPIGSFFLYKTDGLFQSESEVKAYKNDKGVLLQPEAHAGDLKFKDINGDGVIDENDKEYCGNATPKYELNFNLSAEYKGWDFVAVLGGAFGYKLYNGNKYFYEGMNSGSNFLKSALDAWTPTHTNTSVPRAVYKDLNGNLKESDRFLEKGDFFRLRQVQLGYTLPTEWTHKLYLDNLRFYVSGENLFTLTSYKGIDPEFSRSSVLSNGIDKLIYPFTRSYTIGLQLSF